MAKEILFGQDGRTSILAGVDTLAKEFTDDHPDHPSRHYRVFLWMQRRPDRLLDEAANRAIADFRRMDCHRSTRSE